MKLPTVIGDKIEVDYDDSSHECTVISFSRDLTKKEYPWMIQSVIMVELLQKMKKDKKIKLLSGPRLRRSVQQTDCTRSRRTNKKRALSPVKSGRRSALDLDRSRRHIDDAHVNLTSVSQRRRSHDDEIIICTEKQFSISRLTRRVQSFNVRKPRKKAIPTYLIHSDEESETGLFDNPIPITNRTNSLPLLLDPDVNYPTENRENRIGGTRSLNRNQRYDEKGWKLRIVSGKGEKQHNNSSEKES
mmetsp:Transcript_32835/g.48600  ORF Transcript_32835/g.48600 Transcript_32835/m.48600 type:complete len:245 (-) Transcript_32835:8-742(-)